AYDVRADVPGHHDRDLDVRCVEAQVGDQCLGETLHGELCRAVRGVRDVRTERRPEAVHAACVDEVTRVARDEQRQEGTRAVVDTSPVDTKRSLPLFTVAQQETATASYA